jgi:hypothetical protein
MRKPVPALPLLLLALLPASPLAAKVRVDYDRNADFESYRTYAWKATPDTSLDEDYPDIHARIVKGVEYYLTEGDLIEDEENPDLWVTYHARTTSDLRVDTTQMGYMYGAGWAWDPYWGGPGAIPMVGHARTYKRGTFVLDLVDAHTGEIVWRGTAEGQLKSDRDKLKRSIDAVLRKMVRKWRKMYKADGRE